MLRAKQRLSDFPGPRWWGFWVRFFKTFEVLIFKVLQFFDLYRPQKSIVGIPSLATRSFTLMHAVVYNGTQEEVLGYRPRRLFYRVLKGLPDVEFYERIRFQLNVSKNQAHTVSASTENRGFIHLQLPWQLPWHSPEIGWLRMEPLGVETLTGTVALGDYELYTPPVFFLNEKVKWVIISDIDDTIKDSNIAESTSLRAVMKALFRGHYYTYQPIEGMAELYHSLVKQGALIVYLTSTPYQLTPFLLKFLRDNQFPEGPVFPRWLGYGKIRHKWRTIQKLVSTLDHQRCILVGDSGEKDLDVYRRVCENPALGPKVDRILIRHVPGTPVQKKTHPREVFYRTPAEISDHLSYILNC